MKKIKVLICLFLSTTTLKSGEESQEKKWLNLSGLNVGFGYSTRSFDGIQISSDSFSRNYSSTKLTGELISVQPSAGGPEGLLDRNYDNGFVRKDTTGSIGEVTWYWGYEDASQLEEGYIAFKDTSGRDVNHQYSQSSNLFSDEDSEWGNGPMLTLSYIYKKSENLTYSAGLDLSYLQFDNSWGLSNFSSARTTIAKQIVIEDKYNLLGTVPPDPPFAGSFSEPGLLIEAVPSERTESVEDFLNEEVNFTNQIDKDFDFSMVTFSPALTLSYGIENFFLDLGIGPTVNLIDWKSRFTEQLNSSNEIGESEEIASWSDQTSGNEAVLGAFLQLSAGYKISNNWSLKAFGRKDWSKDFENEVGASKINFNLGGMSAGVGATFSF